jgi:hypothetical protein
MMRLVAVALVFAVSPVGQSRESSADRLARFIRDGCDYFGEHADAGIESIQPHFGKLLRVEMITERVYKPYPRYRFEPTLLPRWEAWAESRSVVVRVPTRVSIRLSELERSFGAAEEEVTDRRIMATTPSGDDPGPHYEYPFQFQFTRVGKNKTCTVLIEGDGKYEDVHRQRVAMVTLID